MYFLFKFRIKFLKLGSAYHTVISQITGLLGVNIPKITSPFLISAVNIFTAIHFCFQQIINLYSYTLKTLVEIFKVIDKTNLVTLGISLFTMLFLYLTKTFINERFKHKLYVPIPFDLIIVKKIFLQ